MSDNAIIPNPANFSVNERQGEYTAAISVSGTIYLRIKATDAEDARRQAEAEVERIEGEGFAEVDDIDTLNLDFVAKERPMYRVTREGKPMKVTLLEPGDVPRQPDEHGF